jgi:hypothetical protein
MSVRTSPHPKSKLQDIRSAFPFFWENNVVVWLAEGKILSQRRKFSDVASQKGSKPPKPNSFARKNQKKSQMINKRVLHKYPWFIHTNRRKEVSENSLRPAARTPALTELACFHSIKSAHMAREARLRTRSASAPLSETVLDRTRAVAHIPSITA